MATTGPQPYALPAPQLTDGADIETATVPLRDRLQEVLPLQVPVGALMMWMTDTAPLWWLLCNGQDVDAAQYPRLAAVIAPVGGRIILPDLRGRLPMGASATHALQSTGGAERVKLKSAESGIAVHGHGGAVANSPSLAHSHAAALAGFIQDSGTFTGWALATSGSRQVGVSSSTANSSTLVHSHGLTINNAAAADAVQDHENLPPFMVVNFIVRSD